MSLHTRSSINNYVITKHAERFTTRRHKSIQFSPTRLKRTLRSVLNLGNFRSRHRDWIILWYNFNKFCDEATCFSGYRISRTANYFLLCKFSFHGARIALALRHVWLPRRICIILTFCRRIVIVSILYPSAASISRLTRSRAIKPVRRIDRVEWIVFTIRWPDVLYFKGQSIIFTVFCNINPCKILSGLYNMDF